MHANPDWLNDSHVQAFFAATEAAGGHARAVGGCVRDYLLGRAIGDVDLASSLPPEQTMDIAQQRGWKAIPTGIAHGTVTLVLPSRVVEVTTLRRDVSTDGRRASIAYTDNWQEDAARRDFTINALSMDAAGAIYDYCGGREDLASQRLRFIGDAATRIREDGLRILRYFRFLACYGLVGEEEALIAIAANKTMLTQLSGERIAAEMQKLLAAEHPVPALQRMAECGLDLLLAGTPWQLVALPNLMAREEEFGCAPNLWARLLALIDPAARAAAAPVMAERWKLSRATRQMLMMLAEHPHAVPTLADVKAWLRQYPRPLVISRLLLEASTHPQASPDLAAQVALAQSWVVPIFPVTAADLFARGMAEGVVLGQALRALEQAWVASDYCLSREDLLAQRG